MVAEVGIHEDLVKKVRPGQVAIIFAEPFPDKKFHAKVISIAPLPDPQHSNLRPDIRVYKTKLSIRKTDTPLRPGMSAKVVILVGMLEDVLIVPVQAVANRDGRKVCHVATESGPEEREVQIGAFNDTFVQIVAGLEPGEDVFLNPRE